MNPLPLRHCVLAMSVWDQLCGVAAEHRQEQRKQERTALDNGTVVSSPPKAALQKRHLKALS